MALFEDGLVSAIDDLAAQDAQLLDVASAEGIDVTRKLGLAQEELGLELRALLARMAGPSDLLLMTLAGQADLSRVAVTPPLKLWHTYRSLEMVYGDAYNSQLNDRYAGKRDQFHARAAWAYEKLVGAGLGIVFAPLPQATAPQVTTAAGTPLADAIYYATMAWVNAGGEEGASAAPVSIMTTGSTLVVQPSPPGGVPPANAVAWNVYVGSAPDGMYLQNAVAIGIAQAWRQPAALATVGRKPGCGQRPNYIKPVPRLIQRG
jgi:hypothetical protein